MPVNIILVFEWIAFVFCLFVFHRRNDKSLRVLVIIMTVTVVVEGIASYYKRVLEKANHQFYNISVPLIILLFLWMFMRYYKREKHRNIIKASMVALVAFAFVNGFFLQGITRFCTYTYIAGALLLVLATAFYFLEMVQEPVMISLKKEPMFWLSTGVLILYLPKCILYAAFEYLAYHNESLISFGATFHLMNKILSLIFFSFLSYASICRLIYRN
jgi:hypothetical protein